MARLVRISMPQVTDLDDNAGPKITDLANVGNLKVPQYQRAFTWNKAITTRLLEDLIRHKISFSAHAATEPYYLGNLLIHVDGVNNNVVDGQQRLCATTIICAAIRDTCIQTGTLKKAYEIHSKIIKDQHYDNALTAWHDGTNDSFRNQLRWIQKIRKPNKTQRKFKSNQIANVGGPLQAINIRGRPKTPIWKMNQGVVVFEHGGRLQLEMTLTPLSVNHGVDATFTSLSGFLTNNGVIDQELGVLEEHPDFRGPPPHGIGIASWKKCEMIKRYFECVSVLRGKLAGKNAGAKRQFMEDLANIALNIQFTVSKFTDLAQAIQYFGTFNSRDNVIPLSVGDLMRQWVAYVVQQRPAHHSAAIRTSWRTIDRALNIDCSVGDQLEDFFVSYLIATKRRYTKSAAFSGMEAEYIGRDLTLPPLGRPAHGAPAGVRYGQQLLFQHPNWEKSYIKDTMEDFATAAEIYREICDPEDSSAATLAVGAGDQHAARLKAIWRTNITQFRGLLLAGMIKFRSEVTKGNLSNADRIKSESYLLGIIEYMIVRGYIIPSSVDRTLLAVAPPVTLGKSLDSKVAYNKVEVWSGWLRNHGDLTHYGVRGSPPAEDAAALLDRIKGEVLRITAPFDCLFEDGNGAAQPTLLTLDLMPRYAQLVLVRLELERSMWANAPKADYQVEHIFPQSPEPGEWVAFAAAGLKEENLNKLGNLTLLPSEWNQYVGNSEYTRKQTDPVAAIAATRKDYTRAEVGLNIKLCNEISTSHGVGIYANWTPVEVAARGAILGRELYATFCNASLDSGRF